MSQKAFGRVACIARAAGRKTRNLSKCLVSHKVHVFVMSLYFKADRDTKDFIGTGYTRTRPFQMPQLTKVSQQEQARWRKKGGCVPRATGY